MPIQERKRALGGKENKTYLRIFETDTIKQVEMKEKIRKEDIRRTRKPLETKFNSRKDKHQCSSFCKILETILKMNKIGIQTNGPKD